MADQPYKRHGDKQNSNYFEEYLLSIYKERDKLGITKNVGGMQAIVVEVDLGIAAKYISELLLMTLYDYWYSWNYDGYRWHLLRIDNNSPDLLVRELIDPIKVKTNFVETLNKFGTFQTGKLHTRYVGEIYGVIDLQVLGQQLKHLDVAMVDKDYDFKDKRLTYWTRPSVYTWNQIGYCQASSEKDYPAEAVWEFSEDDRKLFKKMKQLQKELEIDSLIEPFDHLATRVYCHDREHAILEFLSLTSYYFWGAFDIDEQNSSTNVTRSAHELPERVSPAKVFTANNTPFYVKHINKLPSPTEDFVRHHGRRMHHLAVAVKDGFVGPESDDFKNVDFVVSQLKKAEQQFLEHVIGSCDEGLKQVFSKSSKLSGLITEYIQRCYDYEGFFTKHNVAALTMAAGKDDHE